MPPSLPPAKKSNLLVWILVGVGGLVCLATLTCGLGGYFLYRTVKNAGFDPELMKRNPGLAITKMAAALHPDMEVISTNNRTGSITMKDKSTGKVVTFKFDPDAKTLVMTGDDGKQVKVGVTGDGTSSGGVDVQSSEGTMHFGASAGNKAPAWVPVYPGSSPEGTFSAQTPDGDQNTFTFKSKDAAGKVLSYYQDQLKSAGFTVNLAAASDQGGMLQAEDAAKKRSLMVTLSASSEGAQATVIAVEKK
jgi:hypothetical protein